MVVLIGSGRVMGKKYTKVTEGIGLFTGDGECFCIETDTKKKDSANRKILEKLAYNFSNTNRMQAYRELQKLPKHRIYPDDMAPDEIDGERVRFKITIEAEIL